MQTLIARLLGYEEVDTLDSLRVSFGADWAHNGPAWILFGCIALGFIAAVFYIRYQPKAKQKNRVVLSLMRGALLCLLLLVLADPILEIAFTSHPKPVLWILLDGTESMTIEDHLDDETREHLKTAIDLDAVDEAEREAARSRIQPGQADGSQSPSSASGGDRPAGTTTDIPESLSREKLVKGWLSRDNGRVLKDLIDKFRVQIFEFTRSDDIQEIRLTAQGEEAAGFDPGYLTGQYQPDGPVTSLGGAFDDLRRRHSSSSLAGIAVVSDFDHNSGEGPLTAAKETGVPVFTIGVGATNAVDLAVDLQTSLKMKKAESSTVTVTLRQQELDGQSVTVRVIAQPVEPGTDQTSQREIVVGEKTVVLTSPSALLEFPFTPLEAGRFIFSAEVEPLEGEIVDQNNRASREVTIIDDFLRLLFVEYEPTWEWRFVKEVFHRDKLVGLRGFRTYLRSSDPAVREDNELFLPTLTLPRNEFFEHDVIFLGDMPASTLSTRFCEMTKEFVSKFGGGLVVLAGPRFGPGELASTPISDMLPVLVDPDAQLRDDREFTPRLTPMAAQYDFMNLGDTDAANAEAWSNLGRLPWYQPVRRLESSATTVLAEHPFDTCIDNRTPQPLIAVRKYGRGEVVYIAQNEMWRLRRKYGELYYRKFWGQLIHRLGLSHALGNQKRFVVRTDRQQYQPDDTVLVTVEAFDENFEPLSGEDLNNRNLEGEIWLPGRSTEALGETRPISLTEYRPGVFEARVPVAEGGDYVIRVTDPVSEEPVDVFFQVSDLSIERRSATRNRSLQENIAAETGGRTAEIHEAAAVLSAFEAPRLTENTVQVIPLWSTWLCFAVIVGLMFVEWLLRKFSNLV